MKLILVIPLLLISNLELASSQGHYVKNQRIDDHVFPPKIVPPIKGIPQGHLRPLGYQRYSDGKIRALGGSATLLDFHEKCFAIHQPCVAPKHYFPPAKELWGDKYLSQNFADVPVQAEKMKAKIGDKDKNIFLPMIGYLKRYHYEEWKLSMPLPEVMRKDLTVPGFLQCPAQKTTVQYAQLWLQSGEVSTTLRTDAHDEFHCVLSGRIDFIIFHKDNAEDTLKLIELEYENSGLFESRFDENIVDGFKYPEIENAAWKWAILREGDCIYIPAGTAQYARTFGRLLSVSYKTKPIKDGHDYCDSAEVNKDLGYDEIETYWINKNGALVLPDYAEWMPNLLRKYLAAEMGSKAAFHRDNLAHLLNAIHPDFSDAKIDAVFSRLFSLNRSVYEVGKAFAFDVLASESKMKWLATYINSVVKGIPMREEL